MSRNKMSILQGKYKEVMSGYYFRNPIPTLYIAPNKCRHKSPLSLICVALHYSKVVYHNIIHSLQYNDKQVYCISKLAWIVYKFLRKQVHVSFTCVYCLQLWLYLSNFLLNCLVSKFCYDIKLHCLLYLSVTRLSTLWDWKHQLK